MFCPVCKYEFRRGFTKCNECGVDLVDTLPSENASPGLKSPELLWTGDDTNLSTEICSALAAEGIKYAVERQDGFHIYAAFEKSRCEISVWVSTADAPAAARIVQPLEADKAANAEPRDEKNYFQAPYELFAEDGEGPDDIRDENVARELHPEDATAEIWSGADPTTAEILKSCLAEIGIACCVDRPESGNLAVRVLPEDETRARDIVRQVIEGVPPE
jgi:hypothetical protein